jgi:acylphosphatase
MKHINVWISGKVQGVWFRESTRREANKLGLSGFVRNMPDGSVYAEVEGTEQALNLFINWCHRGPELAKVSNVEVQEGHWQGFTNFEVIR